MNPEQMSFEHWWAAEGQWVEPPNERRGGFSGVLRWKSANRTLYIKKQSNHLYRSLRHPLGRPTILREVDALEAMLQLGVPTPKLAFCGTQRSADGQWRAVLVTEELSGFVDSDTWFAQGADQSLTPEARQQLMQKIGETLANMHLGRWQHGCVYGKHVFINSQEAPAKVALLDFEKCRQRLTAAQAANHDLPQLRRHSRFTEQDWQQLLIGYQRLHPIQLKARKR